MNEIEKLHQVATYAHYVLDRVAGMAKKVADGGLDETFTAQQARDLADLFTEVTYVAKRTRADVEAAQGAPSSTSNGRVTLGCRSTARNASSPGRSSRPW